MSAKLSHKIKSLPDSPGVYQFLDKYQKIIYIGKAKNLKKRVKTYFSKNNKSFKTSLMISHIDDVLITVVNSENDAFLLERSLVRQNQPKFNIQLKDGKTYPWICIKKEPFPRVFMTRRVKKDGSIYFGPYSNVRMMHTLLNLIKDLYSLRTCSFDLSDSKISSGKYKECLEFHIGNCNAPCIGGQTKESYQQEIDEIQQILNGNLVEVKKLLKIRMSKAAEGENFELAQKYEIAPSTFANAFVNDRPFVTSNIIGATTMNQLKENIDSIDITLSKEILKEIEEIHLSDPNPCV